jgi:hypothetical protein
MNIVLSARTQKLLEDRMKKGGYVNPDEALFAALESLEEADALELDSETHAAIDRAEAQIARGEYRDWEDVKTELRAKFPGG